MPIRPLSPRTWSLIRSWKAPSKRALGCASPALSRHSRLPLGPFSVSKLAARIARASSDQIARMGITRSRAQTLRALAGAMANGALGLETQAQPETLMARLMEISGIGPWTASYIAMRVLGWPDAFPESDLGLRKALGGLSSRQARDRAERWRPWRAYAVMYLWTHASGRNE